MAAPHDEDTQHIQRVINAAAIRGIMDDSRWNHVIAVITRLMDAAKARETQARRNPTLDGLISATHYTGHVVFGESLLRTLIHLYDGAGKILEDARKTMPYAPQPQGKHAATSAPEPPGDPKGASHARDRGAEERTGEGGGLGESQGTRTRAPGRKVQKRRGTRKSLR